MKISFNWLKDHLAFDLSPEETGEILTSTGLEVESIEKVESVKGGLEGLVIGKVIEKDKHPDADKLSITKVDVGSGEILTIVCGASNVASGQKVVVALNGCTIHPVNGESFKIKKAKIRGVESNGMICAMDEIGLGEDHSGIIVLPESVEVGMPAKEYYQIKTDYVFEIGLTPNRIDAASHRGVARDLRAALINRKKINPALIVNKIELKEGNEKAFEVRIENADSCYRYSSVLIKNVSVGESPEWLKQKLTAIGLRSINNVVDITNYVMHDLGHPLHAFDADEIKDGKIIVRNGKAGNTFITLDGSEKKLDGTELMICDSEKELCIAGVFGGQTSGVSDKTKNIFLESAWFHPVSVRKTARKFGLNTDSSFRFERGADIYMTIPALKMAASSICELAAGEIASSVQDEFPVKVSDTIIPLSIDAIHRLLGKKIELQSIRNILVALDFEIQQENGNEWIVKSPFYRADVTRQEDVAEEILRIYGYNEIELPEKMSSSVSFSSAEDWGMRLEKISDFLSSNGFHEIMTNSLTSSAQMDLVSHETQKKEAVKILNPLSNELDIMRPTLLLNGLHAIQYNLNRQQNNLKFYEFGKIYNKAEEKYNENYRLSIFITGNKLAENWNQPSVKSDIYGLIAVTDALFTRMGIQKNIQKKSGSHTLLNDVIEYYSGKKLLAVVGKTNKQSMKFADLRQEVYCADIDMDVLFSIASKINIRFTDLPKFPAVRRDLSLLLDSKISFSEIENCIRKIKPEWMGEVGLFDVYEGKNLEAGRKSYAVSLQLYNPESTLTDGEVDKVMNEVISSLEKNLGAKLR
jgi:phenylalanyl-tRNA synthetase beta chain